MLNPDAYATIVIYYNCHLLLNRNRFNRLIQYSIRVLRIVEIQMMSGVGYDVDFGLVVPGLLECFSRGFTTFNVHPVVVSVYQISSCPREQVVGSELTHERNWNLDLVYTVDNG